MIVAGARVDHVGAAAAIDEIVSAAGHDGIGADVDPVTVRFDESALASRFSKRVTLTVSPTVWSALAATAKFTWVMPPDTASTSVSTPAPPSIDGFRCRDR